MANLVRPNSVGPVVIPAEGVTQSEKYLAKLCKRSFLSLWSYPGVFRDQGRPGGKGDGKEVCDLLVVFENHIIIFSDKDCLFGDAGDLQVQWARWFRKAVQSSASQVYGADRWIRQFPNRLFLDKQCTIPFPNLEELIRRVVVHTTCKSVEKHLTPVSSRSHTAILGKLKAGDCILTFNYDLLIEESFKKTQLWTPKTGYGVSVHGVTNEWCKNWLKHYFHGTGKHSKISLLKLHGSVHWALYKSGEIKLKDRPFVVRTRDKSTVFETVSILPPGLNKRIDKNPYKRLWKKARLKLEKCKTIIIIGYSLPEADLLARALFAEVVRLRGARRHYLKELHLADPIDSVKQRFIELFVPALNAQSKVFRYLGIEEFRSRVTEKAKSL